MGSRCSTFVFLFGFSVGVIVEFVFGFLRRFRVFRSGVFVEEGREIC